MENCFFRISEETTKLFPKEDLLYHLVKESECIYKVEWKEVETGLINESKYEENDVEKFFKEGDWVAISLEKDENKPCWNCNNLNNLGGCKLNEGICPVWIEADETDNFKCFEKNNKSFF